jgi:predicted dehydrogenase (TIGR03970 family)
VRWDTVIVGGGTTGCVLAARLSEDPDRQVLLLEAGSDYPGGVEQLPEPIRRDQVAMPTMNFLWYYPGVQREGFDREIPVVRGRVIGGSGAVNGAIFQRGLPEDYDAWGSDLWAYDAVLPYFRRYEHDLDFDGPIHGKDGPVPVRRFPPDEWEPSQRAFYEAALALGYPEKPDHQQPDGYGIGPAPRNGYEDVRRSAALTHLQPARGRPNLTVRGDARVLAVRFDGTRATGVDVLGGHGGFSFVEAGEVILTCGGIETPHLLLASGVGPAVELRRHGVSVVADHPGVGKNLRDHPSASLELDAAGCVDEDPRHNVLLVYTAEGSPLRNDMNMLSSSFHVTDETGAVSPFFNMLTILNASESVGEITLTSGDPLAAPRIVYGYLESEFDRRRFREGVRISARLVEQEAYERLGVRRIGPTDDVLDSDDALDAWVAANLFTFFHTCGTCRMGEVVDERGLVHGLEGLRVADLSIAPDVPRAAPNATAFMIGERMADLVRR